MIGESLIDIVTSQAGTVEHVGGSAANIALGVGRLGDPVDFLTFIAHDDRGERIARHLTESGVHVLPGSFAAPRTSTATATIGSDGAASYVFDVDWQLSDPPVGGHDLLHIGAFPGFSRSGAAVLHDYLKGTAATEITFDPNIRAALLGEADDERGTFEELASRCTVVKLSDEDASWLYPETSVEDVVETLLTLGTRLVVVTRGGEGLLLATESARVRVAAPSVPVIDTIGAGDTVMATIIDFVLAHPSREVTENGLLELGTRAAAAAAITVGRRGADLPWAKDLTS